MVAIPCKNVVVIGIAVLKFKSYSWAQNFNFWVLAPKMWGNIVQTPLRYALGRNKAF